MLGSDTLLRPESPARQFVRVTIRAARAAVSVLTAGCGYRHNPARQAEQGETGSGQRTGLFAVKAAISPLCRGFYPDCRSPQRSANRAFSRATPPGNSVSHQRLALTMKYQQTKGLPVPSRG
jgi:hypothetical protein